MEIANFVRVEHQSASHVEVCVAEVSSDINKLYEMLSNTKLYIFIIKSLTIK